MRVPRRFTPRRFQSHDPWPGSVLKIKGILIVDFSGSPKSEILFGRSEEADVMFKDISVSRNHARLVWKSGQLFVFNIESKYGTVRREKGQVPLHRLIGKRFVIDKFTIAVHINPNRKVCRCLRTKQVRYGDNPVDNNKALFVKDAPKAETLNSTKNESQNDKPKHEQKPLKMAKQSKSNGRRKRSNGR